MDDDTLNIELTLDDIKEMHPEVILTVYNKVRANRLEARESDAAARASLRDREAELAAAKQLAAMFEKRVADRDAALAAVAMRLIGLGVLDLVEVE